MSAFRTWVEVNHRALRANLRAFRRFLPLAVKIAPVVKADAYGHSASLVTAALQNEPIWGFCVASGDEVLALDSRLSKKILVLSAWQPTELIPLIRRGVSVVIWDLASARDVERAARNCGRRARVHLKIDTGTSRIGIRVPDLPAVIDFLRTARHLEWEGVFSHLADAESASPRYTDKQLALFFRASAAAPATTLRHIACTAAALRFASAQASMVRLGIGLYGLWPSNTIERAARRHVQLTPVLSWKTRLLQIKSLPAGTPVGYALTFKTKRRTRLGVLPVGYWDGYDRGLSNRGRVALAGTTAPVIGRVSMNLTLIDLTRVPRARAGDVVSLIGGAGESTITADDLARWTRTIHYEIVSRINPLIPRLSV